MEVMPSLSFDPVAHIYDATRGYPDEVAQEIAQAIAHAAHATPETTFLEVGVGTGRIAFPLASLGHIYTGVDISEKMIQRLEGKLLDAGWQEYEQLWGSLPDENGVGAYPVWRFREPEKQAAMRLVLADMTQLPFHNASFNVVIAVHVFHLVEGWQQAIREVLRVLRPGGIFLHCGDECLISPLLVVDEEWRKILFELGGSSRRPGAPSHTVVTQFLREQGLQSEEFRVTHWESAVTPRQAVEYVALRMGSSTWNVPDDLFATSIERLWQWANQYFGDGIDIPRRQVREFGISKTEVSQQQD